jgi:Fe(3+) dicitrate transport protein
VFFLNLLWKNLRNANIAVRIPPAYSVADLSAGYTWRKFTLEGTINNLLNVAYFTRRATGYPGPGIIPGEGRSFYITAGIRL